ncbi:phosphoglucomutase/phosphomannomutase family protein [Flavobacteriales bacterium]|nr:phosphoglucomutase/phosphomannomutase family protein [Flavobacteriales bacterium]
MIEHKIKFGTDGWRAIIAENYTVENVARVSEATAKWVNMNYPKNPTIVIGHDCRYAGELFAETATKVFIKNGIKVILAKDFVSTPMVSLACVKLKASLGVVITASHNPPTYNGYKLKGGFGGPLSPEHVQELQDMIPDASDASFQDVVLENNPLLEYNDMETMYVEEIEANFDLEAIKNSGLQFGYDAMYGAGQNVLRRVLPDTYFLHCEENPSFMGQAPEPIHKNLLEFSEVIRLSGDIACGLATDGDADRIGLYDSKGNFVDSHHIMLIIVNYLFTHKNMTGKVLTAASSTPRLGKMAKEFGLDFEVVKVGFKYIASIMLVEDVLLGGEESGGIAIKGHIPERDGIWMGLVIWEYMAKSGKSLEDLIDEVYKIVGPFKYQRDDLHITEELKLAIMDKCEQDGFSSFGDYKVTSIDKTDGFKFFFDNDEWLMIRASGTEPVLRTYAESDDLAGAQKILAACKKEIGA